MAHNASPPPRPGPGDRRPPQRERGSSPCAPTSRWNAGRDPQGTDRHQLGVPTLDYHPTGGRIPPGKAAVGPAPAGSGSPGEPAANPRVPRTGPPTRRITVAAP